MRFIFKKTARTLIIASEYSPLALLWMVKSFTMDWLMRLWSNYRLRSNQEHYGLHYVKPEEYGKTGWFTGKINGRRVKVIPDDHMQSRVSVKLNTKVPGLEIALSKPYRFPEKSIADFKTHDWKFNMTFRTRRISKELIDGIEENTALIESMNSFFYKYMLNIDSLNCSDDSIFCTFKFGFYFFPYIPAVKVRGITSELSKIAELLEKITEDKKK